MFDRRYEAYEKIYGFIADIMIAGKVPKNADVQFLRDTKPAIFLFDKEVAEFTRQIYSKAVELSTLDSELENLSGDERGSNIKRQREIKEWFQSELKNMKYRFSKYLSLKH